MKSLKIQNLILIEKAEIELGPGLNILTGETGSGKSAILSAIRLIAGERADSQCIRKGADLAIVEAVLEGPIFIRREIHRSGKNRCFIDDEQVSLSQLREISAIERVDQGSSHGIFAQQKEMLDTFAHLTEEVQKYSASYAEEKKEELALQQLLQTPKERELEWSLKDLNLIEEIDWQLGEEEKLTQEHHILTHAQELLEKSSSVAYALTEGGELPAFKRSLASLEGCIRFDPKLEPLAQSLKNALLELEEVGRSMQNYSQRLEANPHRLNEVEKRMAAIESLKRRFGNDIEAQKEKLKATIDHLTHLDEQISHLKSSLDKRGQKNRAWAHEITQKRKTIAPSFASLVQQELKSLNLPHAKFEIKVGESFGEIEFLFSANPGLAPIPLAQCASGGELSRLLLAIKTILSEGTSTLVFDEIDSNVGGQTAAILGKKLKRLAEKRQVICVTHFVQVAKEAVDHFRVAKIEKEQEAFTTITKLSETQREIEYNRMLGHQT